MIDCTSRYHLWNVIHTLFGCDSGKNIGLLNVDRLAQDARVVRDRDGLLPFQSDRLCQA